MSGPISTRRIGDGHSNLTYLVTDGTDTVVVRRPPPPPIPPGANDMLREARIMSALSTTDVPVPRVLATAGEGEVIDVPLYVMTFAKGPVVTTETPHSLSTTQTRREIGLAMADTLAALHDVDWHAIGLGDLGRPEGFNARHVSRMRRLVADAREMRRPSSPTSTTGSWLTRRPNPVRPWCTVTSGSATWYSSRTHRAASRPCSTGNCAPSRPLLDVGYLAATIPEPGHDPNPTAALGTAMLEAGFPTRAELLERYADRSGRDLSTLAWYTTLALWKLAVLYEYSRRRVLNGIGDPYYADPSLVTAFLADARRAAGLSGTTGLHAGASDSRRT